MFDTTEEIRRQLRAGEDGRAEFKELRLGDRGVGSPNAEDFAGELVALANAEGGAVFLGVDDSGAARGIPPDRTGVVENWLVNIASHNCDPPIRPEVRKAVLPAAEGGEALILVGRVPRGVFVHQTSGGRYYLRVGSTKRRLTPAELARLFQERGRGYVFDEQVAFAATVEALHWTRLEAFFGRSPTIPRLDLFRNTRVTSSDADGVDRPTVAGLLAFGKEPTEFLPSAFVEAACYRAARLSSDDLRHAERLDGPVSDQIDAAVGFIARFMRPGPRRSGRQAPAKRPPTTSRWWTRRSSTPSLTATTRFPVRRSVSSCSLTDSRSTVREDCRTRSPSMRCRTGPSPATSSSSASCPGCTADAPDSPFSSHAAKAFA